MIRQAMWMLLVAAFMLGAVGPASAEQPKKAVPEGSEIKGINLRFDSSKPTFGEIADPTFSVHAESGTILEKSRILSLVNTHAIIYRKEDDNVALVAKSMTLDQDNKAAQMEGGVRVTSGRVAVEVDSLSYDDTARIARSDSTATLDDGANRIVGESMAFHPDTNRFELGSGTATIQLAEAAAAKPDAKSPDAGQFKEIRIEKFQKISGNLKDSPIEEIKGPVRMVMVGKDPGDTITLSADLVRMEYSSGAEDRTAKRIALHGNVFIVQTTGDVHADAADIDLESGKAVFTGNVKMSGDRINGASVPSLEMNLKTGDYELSGPGGVISINNDGPARPANEKKP